MDISSANGVHPKVLDASVADRINSVASFNRLAAVVNSTTQTLLARRAETLGRDPIDQRRDIDGECGYPQVIGMDQYMLMYEREIGNRVVSAYADECWAVDPLVYESNSEQATTEFEKAVDKMVTNRVLWHYLHRLDVISGIGSYGVMLMGFDDRQELDAPLLTENGTRDKRTKDRRLTFLQTFDQSQVRIAELNEDVKSVRYKKPMFYEITFPTVSADVISDIEPTDAVATKVHWSRILHAADNRRSSEVFGTPRQKPVFNRLCDIRKILGGSAEMFWQGGFPGLALEVIPELAEEAGDLDLASAKKQLVAYMNRLQRWLAMDGFRVNQLNPNIADPVSHLMQQLHAICAIIRVPLQVFLGVEAGKSTTGETRQDWFRRVSARQNKYVTPLMVRPLIDRLILLGALPKPKEYFVDWTDLNLLADKDKGDVSMKRTQALVQFITGGGETSMTLLDFLVEFMYVPRRRAQAILQAAKNNPNKLTTPVWKQPAQSPAVGGGTSSASNKAAQASKRKPRNGVGSRKPAG